MSGVEQQQRQRQQQEQQQQQRVAGSGAAAVKARRRVANVPDPVTSAAGPSSAVTAPHTSSTLRQAGAGIAASGPSPPASAPSSASAGYVPPSSPPSPTPIIQPRGCVLSRDSGMCGKGPRQSFWVHAADLSPAACVCACGPTEQGSCPRSSPRVRCGCTNSTGCRYAVATDSTVLPLHLRTRCCGLRSSAIVISQPISSVPELSSGFLLYSYEPRIHQ